jgi:hypothetical protein
LQVTIGIYEVPTDGADAGAKAKGFQRSSCENLWVRGNLSGHFVNLMFAAGDLYKVHCPINLQVYPRSFDRNSYGEKDRELPKAAKGFFLVQGIAVERTELGEVRVFCVPSSPANRC